MGTNKKRRIVDWIEKGEIILGEQAICADPCYDPDTWCTIKLLDVRPGKYKCMYNLEQDCFGDIRVTAIQIVHEDYLDRYAFKHRPLDGTVGVDSGMAGIFDLDYYKAVHKSEETCRTFCDDCFYSVYHHRFEDNPEYVDLEAFILSNHLESLDVKDAIVRYKQYTKEHPYAEFKRLERIDITHAEVNCDQSDNVAKGFVSISGDGDGGYPVYIARTRTKDKKIIAIKIDYLI